MGDVYKASMEKQDGELAKGSHGEIELARESYLFLARWS